jgi:ribosomal protein L23
MMALFSRKKNEVKEEAAAPVTVSTRDLSHVLIQPRITEKATMASSMSVYVFDVAASATKREIQSAVERYYKVTPRLVRVVTGPAKSVRNMRTGQRGVKQGGKKAYVYLKKGETITIA